MDTVHVHDLVLDRALNPRLHGVDQEVVEFYASIFKEVVWPPIIADRATRKLLDGWHRVEAAQRAGVYTLHVQWVDAKEEELFALAVKLNLGHGVRLAKEERLKAVARLAREGWTPERIIGFLDCSSGLVKQAEQAEDLRVHYKVAEHPAAKLPTETLAEVAKLDAVYYDDMADIICEIEATPTDVRRAVRAVKKELVESNEEIRKAMLDPEYVKVRQRAAEAAAGGWLMNFATVIDQMEQTRISISAAEREAALAIFRRMRSWADQQLVALGAEEGLSLEGTG